MLSLEFAGTIYKIMGDLINGPSIRNYVQYFAWYMIQTLSNNTSLTMTHPPLVDAQPENPFYCPGSPSTFYVDSLLLRLRKNLGSAQRTDVGIRKLYPFPFWEQGYSPVSNSSSSSYGRDSVKRKRSPSCSFSDIWRSSKQARSFQSVHESSFEITIKRERLDYFPSNAAYSPYQRVQPATAKTTSTTLHDLKLRIRTLESNDIFDIFGQWRLSR
jgi:hypothetical protein